VSIPLPQPLAALALLDSLGGPEVMVILVVILIFFGGEKMPEFARGLGKAIREFKKAAGDVEQEFKRAIDELPEKPAIPSLRPAAPVVSQPPAPASAVPPPAVPTPGEVPAILDEPPGGHGIDA
jgi:TatA/E family protein of Tat protein translocase